VTRKKAKLRARLLCVIFIAPCVSPMSLRAQAQKVVRVAAAADLRFAMAQLSERFEKDTGAKASVTYGSSGNFFSQIQNGAPFDLFFSADIEYPRKLEAVGLAEPGTLYEYAVGRILIWTPADAKVDVKKHGWNVLLDPTIQKIAIANPEHAPYGRAAIIALRRARIYEHVKAKLVLGENITQAAQFVQSGNAQAGIIARSLAASPGMSDGKSWQIPAEMYPTIEQAAVVIKTARNKKAAQEFLNFVRSEPGRRILEQYGFTFPGPMAVGVSAQ
jgi:molybdate transport system substrate-binding protein